MASETTGWDVRTARTRAEIVDAALALFNERGFDTTTFDEIASEAGVGRRTLFRYFPTKEAILFSDFMARHERALQLLAAREPGEPSLVSLIAALRATAQQQLDPARSSLIRQIVSASTSLRDRQRLVVVQHFGDQLAAAVARRQEVAGHSDGNPRTLVATVLACLEEATLKHLRGAEPPVSDLFDDALADCQCAWQALPPVKPNET